MARRRRCCPEERANLGPARGPRSDARCCAQGQGRPVRAFPTPPDRHLCTPDCAERELPFDSGSEPPALTVAARHRGKHHNWTGITWGAHLPSARRSPGARWWPAGEWQFVMRFRRSRGTGAAVIDSIAVAVPILAPQGSRGSDRSRRRRGSRTSVTSMLPSSARRLGSMIIQDTCYHIVRALWHPVPGCRARST